MTGSTTGWMLVLIGLLIAAVGLAWVFVPAFGRLPGDIRIERESGTFYFPMTTCILLSVVAHALPILRRR
jgi:DUF2905 family protein